MNKHYGGIQHNLITLDEMSGVFSDAPDAFAMAAPPNQQLKYLTATEMHRLLYGTFKTQESNMKNTYKLTILYDNGKEYKVNGVYSHEMKTQPTNKGPVKKLLYKAYNKKTRAYTTTEIPARDIAAVTVRKSDEITVTKFKPCASISGKAEKK